MVTYWTTNSSDNDSQNKSICELSEKRKKVMDSDSGSKEVESASDEHQLYKVEKRFAESAEPLQRLFRFLVYIMNKTRPSLELDAVNMLVRLQKTTRW